MADPRPIRKVSHHDVRYLLLIAVRRGADYGCCARRWLIDTCGITVAGKTVYRLLTEMEQASLLVGHLDGDVGAPPDEWVRRIFTLTPRGDAQVVHLCGIYQLGTN